MSAWTEAEQEERIINAAVWRAWRQCGLLGRLSLGKWFISHDEAIRLATEAAKNARAA